MRAWVIGTVVCVAAAATASWTSVRNPLVRDHSGRLSTNAPALSPARAMETFRVAPPYRLSVVAHEPMVAAPVSAVFDENGRLWVVEMGAYMPDVEATGELAPTNRIVVLDDTDGDGYFDTSRVFLDGLVLPRAVAPCFDGALVIEPPNLLFCRDTNGDGRADEKRVLLSGFLGEENPEHAGNSLVYGLDNWWKLSQHHLEFKFDGKQVVTRPTPIVGQWGLTRDDAGRLYYTPNSTALLADTWPKFGAGRNPHMAGNAGIAALAVPETIVWPIRPNPGVNRGYQPGILRENEQLANLTAACGPSLYRASALGANVRGDVFICEPAGNLVKQFHMSEQGGVPRGRNVYSGRELLASWDERFRPVNTCIGWDGALYVLDMYRGVIQHRTYITPYLRDQVMMRKLEQPLAMGRVYKIDLPGAVPIKRPRLSSASDGELLRLLGHPDGWWRDTAQRLLVERCLSAGDGSATARSLRAKSFISELHELAKNPASDWQRVHAMWVLAGIGTFAPEQPGAVEFLDQLATDESSEARSAAALIMAENPQLLGATSTLLARLIALTTDVDRRVRLNAAVALGQQEWSGSTALHDEAKRALIRLIRTSGEDGAMRAAAVSGLAGRAGDVLQNLLEDGAWPANRADERALGEVTEWCLRESDASRTVVIELLGSMTLEDDPRARIVSGKVAGWLRLDSEEPRAINLPREPVALVHAASAQGQPKHRVRDVLTYVDWPGRPPVARRVKPRSLTERERAQFEVGKSVYATCAACHVTDGRGSPGVGPALAGSSLATGPADRAIRIVLHGLEGTYEVGGATFEGSMVPLSLNDEKVASVLTYIRRSFGNSAEPVTSEAVGAVRREHAARNKPWTREELKGGGS